MRLRYYYGEFTLFEDDLPEVEYNSIAGTGPNNIWASAEGDTDNGYNQFYTSISHWDGESWREVWGEHWTDDAGYEPPGMLPWTPVRGVYTDHPDSVWVLQNQSLYKMHKDSNGEAELLENSHHTIIWHPRMFKGTSHNDLWISSDRQIIYHWNGNTVQVYDLPDSEVGHDGSPGIGVDDNMITIAGYLFTMWYETMGSRIIKAYRYE